MIVVKLGGSLSQSDALIKCLNSVEQIYQGRAVVIVPGGGAFADQVRLAQQRWQFDDKTAHSMAILAMQQMALLIKGLKSDFSIARSVTDIRKQLLRQKIVIWSPDIVELECAGVQASWDITSDSLAAWLAKAAFSHGTYSGEVCQLLMQASAYSNSQNRTLLIKDFAIL